MVEANRIGGFTDIPVSCEKNTLTRYNQRLMRSYSPENLVELRTQVKSKPAHMQLRTQKSLLDERANELTSSSSARQ